MTAETRAVKPDKGRPAAWERYFIMKIAVGTLLFCAVVVCWVGTESAVIPGSDHALSMASNRTLVGRMLLLFGLPWHRSPDVGSTCEEVNTKPRITLSKAEAMVLIEAAALKHHVKPAFVKSIVAAESNFDPNAVSPKGAIGLMQLMPDTAKQFGADPAVPEQNIDAGTHYLHDLLERYQARRNSLARAIAAYNAGPAQVDRYRGVPPFRETRAYVARVLNYLRQFGALRKQSALG